MARWLTVPDSAGTISVSCPGECRYRLGVRTRGSQPRDRGSNPRTGTILRSRPHAERATDGTPSFARDSKQGLDLISERISLTGETFPPSLASDDADRRWTLTDDV